MYELDPSRRCETTARSLKERATLLGAGFKLNAQDEPTPAADQPPQPVADAPTPAAPAPAPEAPAPEAQPQEPKV